MSDLISRSALLEALEEEEKSYEDCMIVPSWFSAIRIVEDAPTAYDVEEVVERLEKLQEEYMYPDDDDYVVGQYDGIREALTIIKEEGGLDV